MIATENGNDEMRLARETKNSMNWPKVSDLVRDYGVTRWFVRGAIDSGAVRATHVGVLRVNPADWRRFLATRLPGAGA